MSYAVIATGGKQYKVMSGTVLDVESLGQKDGDSIAFDQVLLVVDGEMVSVGKPTVAEAFVTATVVSPLKGEKIRVAKFLSKSRHRRVNGHRQSLTRVMVNDILIGKKALKTDKSASKAAHSQAEATASVPNEKTKPTRTRKTAPKKSE